MSEGEEIGDALALGMPPRPNLKVFNAVVRAITVDVMHGFVRHEGPTEMLCHHQPMLEKEPVAGIRMLHAP